MNCAIPLPLDQQEAFRGTGTEFTEDVAEAKTEDGKVIFWAWERQMYHSASCCPILNATAKGRSTRSNHLVEYVRPKQDLSLLLLPMVQDFISEIAERLVIARLWSLLSVQFAVGSLPNLTEFDRSRSSSKGGVKI